MDTFFIISLIIFVFLAALIIILVKKILKVIFFIILISLIFILAFGFFIYKDVGNIKENFTKSDKLYLLIENEQVLTGIIIGEETIFIDEIQVNTYNDYLKKKDYNSLLGNNYKIMFVKLDILNEKDNYEILNKTFSKEKIIEIFRSEEPFKEFAENKLDKEVKEDRIKFKGFLFATILVNDLIKSKNPFKMLIYYKKGYISIYPETILFKFVKSIPTSFVNKISAEVITNIEKIKEKV